MKGKKKSSVAKVKRVDVSQSWIAHQSVPGMLLPCDLCSIEMSSVWDRNEWFLLIAMPTPPPRILLNQHRGNNSSGLGRHLWIERGDAA